MGITVARPRVWNDKFLRHYLHRACLVDMETPSSQTRNAPALSATFESALAGSSCPCQISQTSFESSQLHEKPLHSPSTSCSVLAEHNLLPS